MIDKKESPLEVVLRLSKDFDISLGQLEKARIVYAHTIENIKDDFRTGKIPDGDRMSIQSMQILIANRAESEVLKYLVENAKMYR